MCETEPKVADGAKFNSKQTSVILCIHPNTLRKYADAGCIRYTVSPLNGRRLFKGADIKKFWNNKF